MPSREPCSHHGDAPAGGCAPAAAPVVARDDRPAPPAAVFLLPAQRTNPPRILTWSRAEIGGRLARSVEIMTSANDGSFLSSGKSGSSLEKPEAQHAASPVDVAYHVSHASNLGRGQATSLHRQRAGLYINPTGKAFLNTVTSGFPPQPPCRHSPRRRAPACARLAAQEFTRHPGEFVLLGRIHRRFGRATARDDRVFTSMKQRTPFVPSHQSSSPARRADRQLRATLRSRGCADGSRRLLPRAGRCDVCGFASRTRNRRAAASRPAIAACVNRPFIGNRGGHAAL